MDEAKKRDYKAEYKKFQSSKKMKKYRAELNKYNRQKGTYGNGDKKDASHKGGKIVGFENQSKNRGRAEKSRLKKEGKELQRWKVYIKGEKEPFILTGSDKNSVKKFAHQMIRNNKVKIAKIVKEGLIKEFNKKHFLKLFADEAKSLIGQKKYVQKALKSKDLEEWERKEYEAVYEEILERQKELKVRINNVKQMSEGTLTESKQRYVVALDNGEVMSGDKSVTEKRALQIMSKIAKQSNGWVNRFMLGVDYWNGSHPKMKGKPHKANKKKIMVKENFNRRTKMGKLTKSRLIQIIREELINEGITDDVKKLRTQYDTHAGRIREKALKLKEKKQIMKAVGIVNEEIGTMVSKLKKLPVTEVLENVKKSHANKYTKAIETLESICEHNTGWLKENK